MKTPRNILLSRHQSADARLDSIRQSVVATECRVQTEEVRQTPSTAPLPLRAMLKLWIELIVPARRAWTGFAVVWLFIITLNVVESVHSRHQWIQAKGESSELLAAWRQQQRLAQLSDQSRSTVTPQPDKPRNRSAKPTTQKTI